MAAPGSLGPGASGPTRARGRLSDLEGSVGAWPEGGALLVPGRLYHMSDGLALVARAGARASRERLMSAGLRVVTARASASVAALSGAEGHSKPVAFVNWV